MDHADAGDRRSGWGVTDLASLLTSFEESAASGYPGSTSSAASWMSTNAVAVEDATARSMVTLRTSTLFTWYSQCTPASSAPATRSFHCTAQIRLVPHENIPALPESDWSLMRI
eukprot:9501168-Pyramimonas_sp.AAC.1